MNILCGQTIFSLDMSNNFHSLDTNKVYWYSIDIYRRVLVEMKQLKLRGEGRFLQFTWSISRRWKLHIN